MSETCKCGRSGVVRLNRIPYCEAHWKNWKDKVEPADTVERL